MATKQHIPGGDGELPVGEAKRQAIEVWQSVKTPEAWALVGTPEKLEIVRKLIKYSLMRWFKAS